MWKLIFLGVLIWLAIYLVKRLINPASTHKGHSPDSVHEKRSQESAENMVQCAACHVHLPRSEAYLVNGHFYCSEEHIENK